MSKYILEYMEDINPDALKADGFDNCIVGVVDTFEGAVLLYSEHEILKKLMKEMTVEEAEEYFRHNILGAHAGKYMPVYLRDE